MKEVKPKVQIIERKLLTDARGWFLKAIDGNEPNNPFPCEVYITSAKPGESKGGHYHEKAQEWFTLLKGEALLTIINIDTIEKTEFILSELNPGTIYMPHRFAHNFLNIGNEDYILLAYTDRVYDKDDTITFQF
jgi:dTDP-4-dehydrorhamnose 3,5-epimerase-like enzyme